LSYREQVAVVSDKEWLRHSVNVLGYLIPDETRSFPTEEEGAARAGIAS
jgi:SpoIIAA-like